MLPRKVIFRLAIVAILVGLGIGIGSPVFSSQAVAGPGNCTRRC
jgi:hypothetical protein